MATLKSALRFPSRSPAPAPTSDLPPIPFDLSTPAPQRRPQLTSRFSAETLIVKSPPLLTRIRQYTQEHSPPTSPLRSSRLGHVASASESRINILTNDFDSEEASGEEEVLSPRATKAASGGDRWGVGAAREVFEALGKKRHGRSGSGQSGKSVGSIRERPSSPVQRQRASRSFSSPSTSAKGLSPPPRPRRVAPTPPKRAPPPAPRTPSPTPSSTKLVDLPPRSDSRNACASTKFVHLPPQAPRPHSPPSLTVAPLNIHPRPAAATAVARSPTPTPTPFRALLVQPPSTRAVRAKSPGSHLVTLNVGGTSYVTSLETLTRPDRGAGKLGEFVEAVVEEVKAEAERRDQHLAVPTLRSSRRASSLYPSSDDGESILNSSHFAVSPHPSPFPFNEYDLAAHSIDLDLDLERIPISPTSPIDPLVAKKVFLPLPAFANPPPPLSTGARKQQATLVHSPVPHMRVKSIHPDIIPSPTTPRPPRPDSRADSNDEDLSARLHLSHTSGFDEINPFERALGPFFEVLHGQQRELESSGEANVGSPTVVERESMGVPVDVGERTAEDQSRSTMLGVPRGSMRRRVKNARKEKHEVPVPTVELEEEEEEEAGSRPPSLSMSLSTEEAGKQECDEEEEEAVEKEGFEVFLDRAGGVDRATYAAVLTWLRDVPVQLPSLLYAIPRIPAVAVGLPLAFGWASGFITKSSVEEWYKPRNKPPFNPPGVAFPIAWTILYASMGLASHLIVSAYDSAIPGSPLKATADLALKLYWSQYALNLLWTPLFFGLRLPVPAFIDISVLTPMTYALTYYASQVDARAGYLLAPYCAWLTFAAYLNGGFWWLNFGPGKDSAQGKPSVKKDRKDL